MQNGSFFPDAFRPGPEHFIDGRRIKEPGFIPVSRPSDHVVYGAVPEAGSEGVSRAVESAVRSLRVSGWSTRSPRERTGILRKWADLIEANANALAQLEAVGSTRPFTEAIGWDIPFLAEGLRFFAEFADKIGGEVVSTRSDHLGLVLSEPYGVIGAIAPWNFPLVMASWKCGPALATGNAVVLKPSELTPFSAVRLAQLAVEAGLPPGIFNVVQGTGPVTGDALVRHPDVAKIGFTGSTRTGIEIMRVAAESGLKPVTLELGGKSPQLVFADAGDPDRVADIIARGITANAGQVCVAGSRLIVHRSLANALVDSVAQRMEALKPGPTWQPHTTLSPIISEQQAIRIDALVRATVAGGACVRTGAELFETSSGSYYRPTILTHGDREMAAYDEEVFGPVLTVETFEDEEEGIALADHPRYGLAAGVHTRSLDRALRAIRALRTGTVWVNRYGRTADFMLPTGGFKASGIGKDLGRQAVEACLRYKTTLIAFAGEPEGEPS